MTTTESSVTTTDSELTNSYVRNSYIVARTPGDTLFLSRNGILVARLDGYAVIPIEEYRALRPDLDLDWTGR